MKKSLILIISLVVLYVAWYLLSPLWRQDVVDEALPVSTETTQLNQGIEIPSSANNGLQVSKVLEPESFEVPAAPSVTIIESNSAPDIVPELDIQIQPTEIIDDIIVGNDVVMNEPMVEMTATQSSVEKRGTFSDADSRHKGSGDLLVVKDGNSQFIRFENFSVTNGPDLYVTLNKGTGPNGEKVYLSKLKGNQGSQNYDVSGYDLSDYKSVSIYCKAFTTEFSTASL